MDEQGVDVQALSINGYWWYAADRDLAARIVRAQNEGLAKWVAAHPDRFVAMASVALQHPDLAAEQLEDARQAPGSARRLDRRPRERRGSVAAEIRPVLGEGCRARACSCSCTPAAPRTSSSDGALGGRGDLGNIIGNPLETTYFLSRLIFDGTLDKFPGLRVCAAHAGGYLPSYLGRTEAACDVRGNANCANKKKPSEYLSRRS